MHQSTAFRRCAEIRAYESGIDDLRSLLADIRTWDGGIRQFLLYEQCDPEMIERVMTGEIKRSL